MRNGFTAALLGAATLMLAACGGADPTATPAAATLAPTSAFATTPTPTVAAGPTATPTAAPTVPATVDIPNAQTVTLIPVHDATIWEWDASTASGAGPNLFAGNNRQGQARRALLKFDVAGAVPAGATVVFASLIMKTNKGPSGGAVGSFSLHRLLMSWGEGLSAAGSSGAGATAMPGDVTWVWREFESLGWGEQHAGGSFANAASAATVTGTWESTDGAIRDVQAWLDDGATNHGWIIVGDEDDEQSVRRFDSREGMTAPVLTIAYVRMS
jgi:hypothetical protein